MSRIGLQPITIPAGVKVVLEGDLFIAEGPKGRVAQPVFRECPVTIDDGTITVSRVGPEGGHKLVERTVEVIKMLWKGT